MTSDRAAARGMSAGGAAARGTSAGGAAACGTPGGGTSACGASAAGASAGGASGGRSAPPGRAARRPATPRQELAAVLLLGAAGAGLVLLALRQGWAQVRTDLPAPLPDSVVTDSGQSLIPYAEALAVAALASLAAVLATRRLARRAVGVLLAGLGAGLAAAALAGVSAADALTAAAGTLGPATGSGAGNAAGSVTAGSLPGSGSAVPDVAGFHSHVLITAASWQAMTIIGALAIIAAGAAVAWRGPLLPVMSSRYDAPGAGAPERVRPARSGQPRADSASMWESLSHGEDPT